ncbi:MAG TPA: DNA primase [Humisphaera sp.]|nr:DNA primase [Humisphaera sp.]
MSSTSPDEDFGTFNAKLRESINIVELIGRTVSLKKRGKDYVGLCPFHQEKSPSFKVDPGKQFFYCFGCKAAGDIFEFVKRRDRVEFSDARRILAESIGMPLPRFRGSAQQKPGERQGLFELQSAACSYFERLAADPQHGQAARDYLQSRGIDAQSIQRFQIGFALDAWDGLLRGPVGRKFPPEQMLTGGLVKKREKGDGYYDTFRNRLMFPIRDENARVIAFGGRVMPGSQDPAKYLNSPETPLFSKSRCIFGLDLARQRIVETRTAVVVEGYTDVVMAHQFGVSNVVSILGTAMTEQHVGVIRRFADRIVLMFDPDTAGDAAVDRAVGLFLTQPVEIAIATMPADVDPDEYLLQHGAAGFDNIIGTAIDALAYKWKQLQQRFADDESLTAQQKAVSDYLEVLAAARGSGPVDSLRWGSALARVSRLTDIPVEQLNRRFKTSKATPKAPAQTNETPPVEKPVVRRSLTAQDRAERSVLGVLLLEPARWVMVQQQVTLDDFADPMHRRLAEIYWNYQRDEGMPVFNQFMGLLDDPALVELAHDAAGEAETLADPSSLVDEALKYFREARRFRESQKLEAQMRRTDPEQVDALSLLKKLQEQARQPNLRRGLSG